MTLRGKTRLVALVVVTLAAGPVHAAEMDDLGKMERFISVMQGYYGLIEAVHNVASDPDKAAILQLQKIGEIYKNRGDRAESIAVLTDVVERSKSPTVRNAAAIMLADALNETGRATQAVEVLKKALDSNLK
ncbi:MAG: hypothetical protein E2O61_02405 [Gammaproteobacteria bacterium]|nr:MAG: hypothetical protein E2O59_04430 [Gammaproteobacteria bacterium]TDJ39701.1 MAG: hypothetical protein E2O61_02405 [Gammaproteobacteria bacterium]